MMMLSSRRARQTAFAYQLALGSVYALTGEAGPGIRTCHRQREISGVYYYYNILNKLYRRTPMPIGPLPPIYSISNTGLLLQ